MGTLPNTIAKILATTAKLLNETNTTAKKKKKKKKTSTLSSTSNHQISMMNHTEPKKYDAINSIDDSITNQQQ